LLLLQLLQADFYPAHDLHIAALLRLPQLRGRPAAEFQQFAGRLFPHIKAIGTQVADQRRDPVTVPLFQRPATEKAKEGRILRAKAGSLQGLLIGPVFLRGRGSRRRPKEEEASQAKQEWQALHGGAPVAAGWLRSGPDRKRAAYRLG